MDAMLQLCAGLPLALTIVAARANLQRGATLSELVEELGSAREKLAGLRLDSADSDVRAAFDWSRRLLSPSAAHLFSRLSVHPGPQLSLAAVASINASSSSRAQSLVDELMAANMLVRSSGGMYEMHDLLRSYAHENLSGPDLLAAQNGFVGYCLTSMRAVFRATTGREAAFALPWTGPVVPESFASDVNAVAWYRREQTALLAALAICRDRKLDAEFASIALDARPLSIVSGLTSPPEVLERARRANARSMEAEAHRDLSHMRLQAGDREGYNASIDRALELFREDRNEAGEGYVLRGQVMTALYAGQLQGLREHVERLVLFARRSARDDMLIDALALTASVAVEIKAWDWAVEATGEVLVLNPGAFKIQNLALTANRAISLNMVGRWREARELLVAAETPSEHDTPATWGLISEAVVSSAHLNDVEATRSALERYDQYLVKFERQVKTIYSADEYSWITGRVEAAAQSIGLSLTGSETVRAS